MARLQFAQGSSKALKQTLGRGTVNRTPVVIRSSDKLGSAFEERVRKQLASRIGHAAGVLERVTVRFDDVNGPKGGIDTVCRLKAVLAGRPSIVVEKRAESHARAFSLAVAALGTAVSRAQRKYGLGTGSSRRPTAEVRRPPSTKPRPAEIDSASDRRAGGDASARRNTLARAPRATAMLEDSRTRPSRKSTRRSANRGKPSQTKERAAAARLQTPAARSARRG